MPNGHGIFTFPEVSMQPSLAIGGYVAAGVIAGFKDTVNTKSIIWTSFITRETLDCDGYLIVESRRDQMIDFSLYHLSR